MSRLLCVLAILTLLAAPARAQQIEPDVREEAGRQNESQQQQEPERGAELQRREEQPRTEWGILIGGGDGKVFDPSRTNTGLLLGGVRWGRDLGGGPGPVSLLVELLPLFTVSQQSRAWGGGLDLLLRYTPGDADWRPAFLGGIGMVVTDERVPPGETHLNFMPQVGVGLRRMLADDVALTLEYRFHHLSNAGLSESNPGINAHMAVFVVSWLR
ncbi:MAG: acyloxyacyl hydrolase [Acidobacteriota bacterium]